MMIRIQHFTIPQTLHDPAQQGIAKTCKDMQKLFSSKSQTGSGRMVLDIITSQSSRIHYIQSKQPRLKQQFAWIGVEHWRGSCGRPVPPLCKMELICVRVCVCVCHSSQQIYEYDVVWIDIYWIVHYDWIYLILQWLKYIWEISELFNRLYWFHCIAICNTKQEYAIVCNKKKKSSFTWFM